jgi:hypothetical protein
VRAWGVISPIFSVNTVALSGLATEPINDGLRHLGFMFGRIKTVISTFDQDDFDGISFQEKI